MNTDKKDTARMDTDRMDADKMDADRSLPPRPRWYACAIIGTATVLVALVLTEVLVDNAPDTLLGFFTGVLGAGLVGVILGIETSRKRAVRLRDAAALDDLEPLRSATAIDRGEQR